MRSASRGDVPKRLFDVAVSAVALVMLSPLLTVVALLVRLRLGSPVLYRQERPGMGGRPFTIYKFRTMIPEEVDEAGLPLTDEQRTPRLARRLRAWSIDELPELWNVLKGDMSLVGPRPLLMEYLPRYSADQARRHEVRPGITGLAQVSGRNAIDWDQRFALDLEYVDNHDLGMDLDIMRRTIRAVILREGISHGPDTDMPFFLGSHERNSEQRSTR